jgi:predicted permease
LAGGGGSPISVQGYARKATDDWFVSWSLVAPRFFETTGTQLMLGRDFSERDAEGAPKAAIVSESFAHFYLPGQNPIGQRFGMRRDTDYPLEIVGVVKDVKRDSLRDHDVKMIYLPYWQDMTHLWGLSIVVRTAEHTPGMVARIRQELHDIEPNLPVTTIQSMEEQLDDSLAQERLIAGLSGFFGALAVALACIGLYGVMSYTAARRTNEIGIRLALGATRLEVLGMVLRECLWLVAAGVALGVPAVLACSRFIQSSLFGIQGGDPGTIGGSAAAMLAVAALAAMLPARRAARVDPMIALRYE